MNTTPRLATPNTRLAPRSPRVRIPAATVVSLVFALVISWFLPWAILGGQTSLSGVAWLAGAAALSLALLFSRWHQPHIDDRDLDLILAALLGLRAWWRELERRRQLATPPPAKHLKRPVIRIIPK